MKTDEPTPKKQQRRNQLVRGAGIKSMEKETNKKEVPNGKSFKIMHGSNKMEGVINRKS